MKAIILAAGRGSRLWPLTADSPKCLLQLGAESTAETILEHQVGNLRKAGLQRIVFVCGFGADMVRNAIERCAAGIGIDLKVLYNPFYAVSDNLISLWAARSEMDGDFLLLNGDNVFDAGILRPMLTSQEPICLTVASKPIYNNDHMRVQIEGDRIIRIGKHIPATSTDAASLGVMRFSGAGAGLMRSMLESAVSERRALSHSFPHTIQRLSDAGHRVAYRHTSLPCIDVDTLADLEAARRWATALAPASPVASSLASMVDERRVAS